MAISQDFEGLIRESENIAGMTVPGSHNQDIEQAGNVLIESRRELLAIPGRDLKHKNGKMASDYRPISHGWPFLVALITMLLVAAGLIELGVQTLPIKEESGSILQRRSLAISSQTPISISATLSTTIPTADECKTTLTQPWVIITVTKTAATLRTETTTKTAIVTETVETILTVNSTVVQETSAITSSPLLARRACITVIDSEENTETVTIDPSDYVQTGTVTITMTQTLVVGRTETALITLPNTLPSTVTWIPEPTPKNTMSVTISAVIETSAAQEIHSSIGSPAQASISPVDSSSQGEQVTLTLALPSSLGGNTVIVLPATSLSTPTGGSEIWSNVGEQDFTSTSGTKTNSILGVNVVPLKTRLESLLIANTYPPDEGSTATWSTITTVLTDSRGIPISTLTKEALFLNILKTLTNNRGSPTATMTYSGWIVAQTTTIIDSDGKPSLTVTESILVSPYTTVMRDGLGSPTATLTLGSTFLLPGSTPTKSQVPSRLQDSPLTTVLSDSEGKPITTITFPPISANTTTTSSYSNKLPTATITTQGPDTSTITQISTAVFTISSTQYFTGMFLATLLATLIAIPIRLIDLNAKRLQPFHAMTRAGGALASESLLMNIGGIDAFLAGFKTLRIGDGLISMTNLLMVSSALLAPLAAEAISITMHGDCKRGNMDANCALSLAVSIRSARAAECILFIMAVLVIGVLIILRHRNSGVKRDPWSMEGLAPLLTHPDTYKMIASVPFNGTKISNPDFKKVLGDAYFRLESFPTRNGLEYGIVARQSGPSEPTFLSRFTFSISTPPSFRSNTNRTPSSNPENKLFKHYQPIFALRITGLALHLVFLLGILILIVTYNNTGGPTGFEHFMDSETFGVRFLFTFLGVMTLYLFSGIFSGICTLMPYKVPYSVSSRSLCSRPPPTNSFEALWSSLRAYPRSPLLFFVSILNISAEFLPVLLANVPYRTTQTYMTHMVCTWLCVAILCLFILTILYLLCFVRWPALPADVRTVAGAAWYLVIPEERAHYGSQVEKTTGSGSGSDESVVKAGKVVRQGEGQHLLREDVETSGNNYV